MSKEFEKLAALLHVSEPRENAPQVDRGEAAKLAARWGWLVRRAREQRSSLRKGGSTRAILQSTVPRQIALKSVKVGSGLSPIDEVRDGRDLKNGNPACSYLHAHLA